MNFVFLTVLIAEAIIIYHINGKNIISPSLISCAVFIVSAVVYIIGGDLYNQEIRIKTVIVIAAMIFCIFLGESIVNLSKKNKNYIKLKEQGKAVVLPRYVCVILVSFVAIVGVFYFISVYRFSLLVGNTEGNYFGTAGYVRRSGEYKIGFWLGQTTLLSECLFYFFIYSFSYNKAITGKFFYRYLWIVPAYAIHIFAIDNRISLLRIIIISFIIMFFVIKQSAMWSKRYDLRIVLISALVIVVFLVLFRLLGYRTGVSNEDNGFLTIVQYCSSGLYGLDKFLYGEITAINNLFAQRTLLSLYELLNSWGIGSYEISHFDEFFFYGTAKSNIYTGIKGLIQDFTVLGAGLFLIVWGIMVSWLTNSIKYNKFNFLKLFILGFLFYPIVLLSIDFTFSTTIRISTVYMLVYCSLIVWLAGIFRDKKYDKGYISAVS